MSITQPEEIEEGWEDEKSHSDRFEKSRGK